VIPDIGGYTAFMKAHRTSLVHAQDVVARLLEAVIDAAPRLTLLEIEGDAAFFYTWAENRQDGSFARLAANQIVAMYRVFHICQQAIATLNYLLLFRDAGRRSNSGSSSWRTSATWPSNL
jgi:hypothetical protein